MLHLLPAFPIQRMVLLAGLLLTAEAARAQQDLVINASNFNHPGGTYRNVTINAGYLSLSGPLVVTGALVVKSGAAFVPSCNAVSGPGSFELQAGATLYSCKAEGITRTALSGDIQLTGPRSYSSDATYYYHGSNNSTGTGVQVTGDGLPTSVVAVVAQGGVSLTLTQDLTVRTGIVHARNVLLDGHRLTLASDASGTALASPLGAFNTSQIMPTNGGQIVMQRYVPAGPNTGTGYRHLSVPFVGATVADLALAGVPPVVNAAYNTTAAATLVTPFPTVFGYDERRLTTSPATDLATFDKGWVSPASPTEPLTSGRGYTVQLAAGQTLAWTGTPVTGPVSVPLTRAGGTSGGWHLVGNPYPAPLDWTKVSLPSTIDNAFYVYQSTGRYAGQYRSYVNGIGIPPQLAIGQGFFVRVNTPGATPTLTFTHAVRIHEYYNYPNGFPAYRTATDSRPVVQLTLGSPGTTLSDEAYMYFEAGATPGVDPQYDALKFQYSTGGAPTLYTQAAGTEMSINGLPALSGRTVVPLGLALPAAGTYTLHAAELRNLTGARVHLHDVATSQDVDLQQQPTYSFTAAAGSLTGRFELRIDPARPTATQPGLAAASVSVYPNPARHDVAVLVPAVAGASQVQASLLNAFGQAVRQQVVPLPAAGARLVFQLDGLPAGVYSVQLWAGEAVVTKRVVVE